jgi:hypothetical protein
MTRARTSDLGMSSHEDLTMIVHSSQQTIGSIAARFAALALTVLGACAPADIDGGADHEVASTVLAASAPPRPVIVREPGASIVRPPKGFTARRVIGEVPAGIDCPIGNPGWELYGVAPAGQRLVSREGTSFCTYRWVHDSEPDTSTAHEYCPPQHACCQDYDGDGLPDHRIPNAPDPDTGEVTYRPCGLIPSGERWLCPDDEGLYAAALPPQATQIVASAIREKHRAEMGTPSIMPRGKKYFTELPGKIKVYVLDDGDDSSPGVHSEAVSAWIKQTACPDAGDCGIWLQKRKVVMRGNGPGSIEKLAEEIKAAADDAGSWRALINVSLENDPRRAWSADRSPTGDDVPNHELKIVHHHLETALNYARCKGIPVTAAAGNVENGPSQFAGFGIWGANVTFPAAFAVHGRGVQCPSGSDPGAAAYAAGGIAYHGANAPSTRLNGQACLVAPTTGLTTDGSALEGTSFSAAAITGAAAAIWRYAPLATGHEIMRILRTEADVIGGVSNVCEFDNGGTRRVNICKSMKAALDHTCQKASASADAKIYSFACGMRDSLTCPTIPSIRLVSVPAGDSELLAKVAKDVALPRAYEEVSAPMSCPGDLYADASYRNDVACPQGTASDGTAEADALSTSPGQIGCAGCTVMHLSDNSLWFLGALENTQVLSPTVNVGMRDVGHTSVIKSFEVGNVLATHSAGQSFAIQLTQGVAASTLLSSTFSYMLFEQGTFTGHIMGLPLLSL